MSFQQGLSGLDVAAKNLDAIGNNIANASTIGYKSERAEFADVFANSLSGGGGVQIGIGAKVAAVKQQFTQGNIETTSNPLDVAINGDGFLVIQTAQGERYTRNGALEISPQGELVTSEGYQVLGDGGPIAFQNQDTGITINQEGTISVKDPSNSTVAIVRGQLRVVSFAQAQRLEKEGGSTFSAPADMPASPSTKFKIVQGALEKSNVQPIIEMSRMIEVSRAYAMIANLLQSRGDLFKTSIQQLADVPTS